MVLDQIQAQNTWNRIISDLFYPNFLMLPVQLKIERSGIIFCSLSPYSVHLLSFFSCPFSFLFCIFLSGSYFKRQNKRILCLFSTLIRKSKFSVFSDKTEIIVLDKVMKNIHWFLVLKSKRNWEVDHGAARWIISQ